MAYFSLVGRTIDYALDGGPGTTPVTKNGVVDSVTMKNGVIEFTVGSDKFTMDKITGVYNTLQQEQQKTAAAEQPVGTDQQAGTESQTPAGQSDQQATTQSSVEEAAASTSTQP
jgi:hypothetical protein